MGNQTLRTILVCAFIAILGFFLLTEHRAHLFGALPYLFLLACPLIHLLLHGRHGGHDSDDQLGAKQGRPQGRGGGHSHE